MPTRLFPSGRLPPRESYLRIDRLLDAAQPERREAIHPGYGFLAENPEFARACADAGMVFIGPPVSRHGVDGLEDRGPPCGDPGGPAGGSRRRPQPRKLRGSAPQSRTEIGYPVMLKASAGGGGKGLRLVRRGIRAGIRLPHGAFGGAERFWRRLGLPGKVSSSIPATLKSRFSATGTAT